VHYRGRAALQRRVSIKKRNRLLAAEGEPIKPPPSLSSEHHRLIPIKQNPILHVQPHSAREHDLLQVTAFADEVFDSVAMRNADHVLLDDGTVVENFRRWIAAHS
jgi:hypothetical protein